MLPGADELFRSTGPIQRPSESGQADEAPEAEHRDEAAPPTEGSAGQRTASVRPTGARRPSGRQRHEEKITVYVSPTELVDLEHARLVLRAEHSLAVDRGRIVREALAVVLADLESKGEHSILVRRLRSR
jgi:hypothetical protein